MNPVKNEDGTINFKNVLAFSIVLLISFAISLYIFKDNVYALTVTSDIINPALNLFASISLLYAAKLSKGYGKRVYWGWLFLGIGQLIFTIGDISWGFIELYLNLEPFFSIADVFYLLYYPLFAVGIFLLPRMKVNRLNLAKTVLDILIMILTIGLLLLTFLMMPLLAKNSGNLNQMILSASYVLLDFVLIFALLDLIYTRIGDIKDPLILLAAGISVQVISDVLFSYQSTAGTYVSGSLLDLGWLVGFVLIGLAGVLQANNALQKLPLKFSTYTPAWLSYMPFIWIVIAYLTFAWSYGQNKLHFENIIFTGSIIIVLVIFRQIIAYKEVKKLYNEAENEILRRVQTQKILKQERDRAQKYLEMAGTLILVFNHKKRIVLINKKVSDVLGYNEPDLIGKGPEFFSNSPQLFELLDANEEGHCEENISSKDDEEKFISWNNSIIRDDNGHLSGVILSGEDITARRIAELQKKENIENTIKRQKALLELSQKNLEDLNLFLKDLIKVSSQIIDVERVSIWFFNKDKSTINCHILYSLSHDTYESGEILEAETYPNYFNGIKTRHTIAANDAQVDPLTAEFTESYLKPLKITSMMDAPIWLHGKLIGVLCHEHVGEPFRTWTLDEQDFANAMANLISLALEAYERDKAEEQIKESLHEKEILIKEIHHRVKNNMQIISSLLNLQSRQITDPEVAGIFKESQSRVKSMSMIHERLYQSKTLSSINFSEYINSLSRELVPTFSRKPDKINLKVNAENIQLNIDTAIPCGLILTEIISNSLKYAFPEGKGTVCVDFYRANDGFVLKIADDGVGIPESVNYENTTTLGILLINSLTEQINGEISLDTSHGTSYTIKFHEVEYEARI